MIKQGRVLVSACLPFDYVIRNVPAPVELILLLHGYAETGERMLRALEASLPDDAVILAPNGPFPMPYRKDGGYRVGSAWYFYDPASKEYFIDPAIAVEFLAGGVTQLGLSSLPKRIIGFSQGGYLAPFAAARLDEVKQIIGIGCEYLVDEWPQGSSVRIDAVHGAMDEVVPVREAQASHEAALKRGHQGVFRAIPGEAHRIENGILEATKSLLNPRV